jgi:hypothetical protein
VQRCGNLDLHPLAEVVRAQVQPIIEQYKKDNATAYAEHDPVTGEALMLRTSTGMQSLYVYDATDNPTALLTSGAYTAVAFAIDTVRSGGDNLPRRSTEQ